MLKIGTRGSHLATTQAGHVRDDLGAVGHPAELKIVVTPGDLSQAPVERIGVGVFTSALRDALFNGEVDVAVHSFKDLPTAYEPRSYLIVPKREDNREALIARDGLTLAELPEGARVGTSAPRRISQLRAMRPDLDIRPLRGNIERRMGYVESGELDAIMLAYAGLVRGGYGDRATQIFDPHEFIPAPAQGALAVECRVDDEAGREAIAKLIDDTATTEARAERTVLAVLEAGCTAPVAATARVTDNGIELRAGVFALDGSRSLVEDVQGADPEEVGRRAAEALLERGAADVMK
ncbi:hydroxymethylbilane synthase [Corynebacterium coyleae]|uniref:hydroxymethylbilane synthase n=1 Tax=Corynebacterium coyleae TaxID=53374 RepID=UPI00254AEA75|nr:hydroxymethylbilane synthase [Corynebacterium coyleae]MDK8664592.1 hydroxymethylbilane synthase [Corynebacterium coyleae]MDK8707686.1 hydroxymethylbilane synthase [Corynebacterium coyleae]MDK8734534.1 hydroxymethylbilane synthase [Corynebacterium coyleae]MDK8893742.1 hydroxymethylbilane synthase [Corynebacterium coyleae]